MSVAYNPDDIRSIDDVLSRLDLILDECTGENDTSGIFAYIYQRTTEEIKRAVLEGEFSDSPGMEAFDVYFAKLYFEAYYNSRENLPLSRTWAKAFQYRNRNLTILQHAILGMNAHINLDLALTAAEMAPPDGIESIREDFMKVNQILAGLTRELEQRLSRVSPLFFLFNLIGGRKDEALVGWSIRKARQESWDFAKEISVLPEEKRKKAIEKKDKRMEKLGQMVAKPPSFLLAWGLLMIRIFETKRVEKVIQRLRK